MVDSNMDFLECSIFQISIQHFEVELLRMIYVLFLNLDKGLLSTFFLSNFDLVRKYQSQRLKTINKFKFGSL